MNTFLTCLFKNRSLHISAIVVVLNAYPLQSQSFILECENGTGQGIEISSETGGYSGTGYISSFDLAGDFLELSWTSDNPDVYKVELIYNSTSIDNSATSAEIDGTIYGDFYTARSDTFISLNLGTHFFDVGTHKITLLFKSAKLDLDYIKLSPVSDIEGISIEGEPTRIEAEDGILYGTRVELAAGGFSGQGYVADFDTPNEDRVEIIINADEGGLYQLKIGYASPFGYKENYLSVNGGPSQTIVFDEVIGFGEVNAGKIELQQGKNSIVLSHFWGWFYLDYFEISTVIGMVPQAIAKGNILAEDLDADGQELIILDGTASLDPDGQIIKYEWFLDTALLGSEPLISTTLPIGSHQITFIVTDNDQNESTQPVSVIVANLNHLSHHRVSIRNGLDSLFMSGINIAWTKNSNFAKDLTNFSESDWKMILDDVQNAGGNAIRWWLHTNGSASPIFGSDGKVTGINTGSIENMRMILDLALDRGIMVSMCLWSFDMLQNQGQNLSATRALLEDSLATFAYINNALIPILNEIGSHPAVMTWEIFNEPEGMTEEFGWSDQRTTMPHVQRMINLCAGAIHRTVPTAIVSNGSWSFRASSDVGTFTNFYADDTLMAAGGDPQGILDVVQVHYYDHLGIEASPFHHPASHWDIDKPIIIGEFPANGIDGFTIEECYDFAFRLGYAGALSWSYSDLQFGGLPASVPGIKHLFDNYPSDIIVPDSNMVVNVEEFEGAPNYRMFPNPVQHELFLETFHAPVSHLILEITDMRGVIIKRNYINDHPIETIQVGDLSSGTYHLRIIGEGEIFNRLFIKI